VFQEALVELASDDERADIEQGQPWAKCGTTGRTHYQRRAFRHELASALTLLGNGSEVLQDVTEADLVVYLVAAHHGRVRLGIRSVPEDGADGYVLGLAEGDPIPAIEIPGGILPASALSLEPVRLGRSQEGSPSWSERALVLRDRPDMGPFRLGFLEAVVRLADWRASAASAGATEGKVRK
jgi:CRISPR-associated endonuclease/helicase Cas3